MVSLGEVLLLQRDVTETPPGVVVQLVSFE